jgi:hypothetical protein
VLLSVPVGFDSRDNPLLNLFHRVFPGHLSDSTIPLLSWVSSQPCAPAPFPLPIFPKFAPKQHNRVHKFNQTLEATSHPRAITIKGQYRRHRAWKKRRSSNTVTIPGNKDLVRQRSYFSRRETTTLFQSQYEKELSITTASQYFFPAPLHNDLFASVSTDEYYQEPLQNTEAIRETHPRTT